MSDIIAAVALMRRADAVAAIQEEDDDLYDRLEQAADDLYDTAIEEGYEGVRVPRLLALTGIVTCELCAKTFWPQRKSARFCSEACKKVAKRRREP